MSILKPYLEFLAEQIKYGNNFLLHSDTRGWSAEIVPEFLKMGILVQAKNASHIRCPGCHEGCYVEPDVFMLDNGDCHMQILCREQGCRVDLDAELLTQYEILPQQLLKYGISWEETGSEDHKVKYSYEWLGDTWRLVFDGEETHLRNTKGARILAILLNNQNRELYCCDLQAQESKNPIVKLHEFEDPVADQEAIDAYKGIVQELKEEVEDAERCHDLGRKDKAQDELGKLQEHLLKITGMGGKSRKFNTDAEKARVAVRKNVSGLIQAEAMDKIPQARKHFENAITYGKFIRYSPEQEINWNIEEKKS